METIFNQEPSGNRCIGDDWLWELVSTDIEMMPASRMAPAITKTFALMSYQSGCCT